MAADNRIEQSRLALHGHLSAGLGLDVWRVHLYVPDQVPTPCAWLDSYRLAWSPEGNANWVSIAWSVVLGVDGADQVQLKALDAGVARAWDACDQPREMLRVDSAEFRPINIGGPIVRAAVLSVNAVIMAATLCPSTLVGSTP